MHKRTKTDTQHYKHNNTFIEMSRSIAGHNDDVLMHRDNNASSIQRQIVVHDLRHRRILEQHRDGEALRRGTIHDDGRKL